MPGAEVGIGEAVRLNALRAEHDDLGIRVALDTEVVGAPRGYPGEIRYSRRRRRVGLVGDPAAVAVRAARGSPDAGPEHRIALRVAVLVVNLDKRVVARSDAVPVVVEVGLDGLAVPLPGLTQPDPEQFHQ